MSNTDTDALFFFEHDVLFPWTVHFDAKDAGDLSTLFDVGGIVGKFKASTGWILFWNPF